MADTAGALIAQLLPLADRHFVPPLLDAEIAERVLGPSGAPRTPHRRLLDAMNGGYFFGRALHLFGACDEPAWHSLARWNSASLWRDAYGDVARDLVVFAEDAFGDQFAYSGFGGEVVCLEGELGRVSSIAPHFVAWLEAVLAAPTEVLPIDVLAREADAGRPLADGQQLYAYPPLCTIESKSDVTIGHVDAVEAMRFRGDLARQLRDLPPGTRVRIDVE